LGEESRDFSGFLYRIYGIISQKLLSYGYNCKRLQTMRVFKKYLPLMVAKHVKTFFKGRIYIHGRGRFDFQSGLLMMPTSADIPHRQTVVEVNELISRLHMDAA